MKYLSISGDIQAVAYELDIHINHIKKVVFDTLKLLDIKYPDFEKWFDRVFVETLDTQISRDIILAIENKSIAGILILKDFDGEKKVCTVVVSPNYRKQGIATKLFELSFEYLGTRKPSFTISQDVVPTFTGIIRKFKFKLSNIDYTYNKDNVEFYYN